MQFAQVWLVFLKLCKLSSTGVLEEGVGATVGGGQQATWLVAKQAVEFPQVLASH